MNEEIARSLKEGILEANNESTSRIVDSEYTTFISGNGKTRYPTKVVGSVVKYTAGGLLRDANDVMAIGYGLEQMRDFYNKLNRPEKEETEKKD